MWDRETKSIGPRSNAAARNRKRRPLRVVVVKADAPIARVTRSLTSDLRWRRACQADATLNAEPAIRNDKCQKLARVGLIRDVHVRGAGIHRIPSISACTVESKGWQ